MANVYIEMEMRNAIVLVDFLAKHVNLIFFFLAYFVF